MQSNVGRLYRFTLGKLGITLLPCICLINLGWIRCRRLWDMLPGYGRVLSTGAVVLPDLTLKLLKAEDFYSTFGEFADLWKTTWSGDDSPCGPDAIFCVKVIRGIVTNEDKRNTIRHRLMEVFTLWYRIDAFKHPNIAPFFGLKHDMGSFPSPVLLYYKNGNILAYLRNNAGVDKLQLMKDVASALSFLHNLLEKIAHGNLKAANILIKEDMRACLTDVGLYAVVSQSDFTTANIAGSCRWAAPEQMDPPPSDNGEVTTAQPTPEADVYSYSMTLIEVYTGEEPFSHKKQDTAVIFEVMRGNRPRRPANEELTDELWELLECCWRGEPSKRPSIDNVLASLQSFSTLSLA